MITVKETRIDEALLVDKTITEFDGSYTKDVFEQRYHGKNKMIIVAYVDDIAAGYMVAYDEFSDGSLYCWMTGVNPVYRKKGILKEMMNYLNTWAQENGYTSIKIKTKNNRREMLFYLVKYGFNFTRVDEMPVILDNWIYLEKKLNIEN